MSTQVILTFKPDNLKDEVDKSFYIIRALGNPNALVMYLDLKNLIIVL